MLFHLAEAIRNMKKLTFLALIAAALAFPTLASAHDFHRGWHGRGHAHVGFFAPIPVPVPFGFVRPAYYAPRPVYVAPAYPAPVYAAPAPFYYPPVPGGYYAPGPVIAIRTPHVAVSIGGWFPF